MKIPFFSRQRQLRRDIRNLRQEIETTRSRNDIPAELVLQFAHEKVTPEFLAPYEQPDPLVTICIATYNRADLVVNRAIASLTGQTYRNIEIVVVGDCCTDDTAKLVAECSDVRIKFTNLTERGDYPPDAPRRWMVAGTKAINTALDMATGDFICHCDDDDKFDESKIEKLVNFVRESRAHFVWHPFYNETIEGNWIINPAKKLELGSATTSSIFYHRWLKRIQWDPEAWRYDEPGDWNRIRRIKYLGAKTLRYNEPLIRHYKERNQKSA